MKKLTRLTAWVLSLALVLSITTLSVLAATFGYIKTATPGSSVNVRKTTSTTAASVAVVKDGTKVEVVSSSGEWYKIKVGTKTGYIKKTYVTSKAPGTTTTTSTTSKAQTGTATANANVYKTAKADSKNVLTTVKKGAKFPVLSSTTSFYKVTVSGKTGYILKKYVTVASESTSTTPNTSTTARPGDKFGYTGSTITKPADIVTGRVAFLNAINWNITQMNTSFSIKVKDYTGVEAPTRMSQLERYFVSEMIPSAPKQLDGGIMQIDYQVRYNEAGLVVLDMLHGKPISNNAKASAIKVEAEKIIKAIEGKSEYDKILYIHDYVVKTAGYDEAQTPDSRTPYGTLVKGIASCQGYAETVQMLSVLAGLENRFVWANSLMGEATGTHGFNKVKIDGKWYNVDATVDDPFPDKPGRVKHDYLLVTDKVSQQRYKFDTTRYPASVTNNNWHMRNKLVAKSQAELIALVKKGVAAKQKYVSVWVEDYASTKYSTAFAKTLPGVKSASGTNTPSSNQSKPFATAIFIEFTY